MGKVSFQISPPSCRLIVGQTSSLTLIRARKKTLNSTSYTPSKIWHFVLFWWSTWINVYSSRTNFSFFFSQDSTNFCFKILSQLHICQSGFGPALCSKSNTDSEPKSPQLRLGHFWVGDDDQYSPAGFELRHEPDLPHPQPFYNRPSGHWPCVKSCLVRGSDRYTQLHICLIGDANFLNLRHASILVCKRINKRKRFHSVKVDGSLHKFDWTLPYFPSPTYLSLWEFFSSFFFHFLFNPFLVRYFRVLSLSLSLSLYIYIYIYICACVCVFTQPLHTSRIQHKVNFLSRF